MHNRVEFVYLEMVIVVEWKRKVVAQPLKKEEEGLCSLVDCLLGFLLQLAVTVNDCVILNHGVS